MPNSAFAWLVRSMMWLAAAGLLVLLLISGITTPADNAIYDLHARVWHYTPDNDVIIIAIDPKSLDAVGRFPWPRSVYAQLIDRLTADGVRGIGMDVTMSTPESDNPHNDQLLADAMHRNGKVVMPVFAEAVALGGALQEALPVPPIAQNVAALGQVDVAKDSDEIVRGAYLKAGLGSAYWPSLALALQQLAHTAPATLPGLRDPLANDASPYFWMRDDYVLLRYAGPDGTFGRLSFADVLNGNVPASLLKGRWVLIGATAEGLGDILQTPDSPMPGVEYQANVLESLRRGLLVTPLNFLAQLVVASGVLVIPLLLYGLPGLRRNSQLLLLSVLVALTLCVVLLRVFYLWWPPTACLSIIGIAFLAWNLFMRTPHKRASSTIP
jgi:adenylate cyclase